MNAITGMLGRVVDAILPWPSRRERRAAIEAARGEKEASRHAAARAAQLRAAVDRMAAENHFAASIAEQVIARHRGERA